MSEDTKYAVVWNKGFVSDSDFYATLKEAKEVVKNNLHSPGDEAFIYKFTPILKAFKPDDPPVEFEKP